MRIKEGFVLREVCGSKVVMGEGLENINFHKIVNLNDSAAYLWNEVLGKDFDAEMMADLLCERYDVEREKALEDSKVLAQKFLEAGVAE